jgi:predicted dehydrogenase
VHAIDLQCWWLGAQVKRVLARSSIDRRGVEHGTLAILEFDDGVLGSVLSSDQRKPARPGAPGKAEFRAVLIGTRGMIEVDSYGTAHLYQGSKMKALGALPAWRSFTSPKRLEAYRDALDGFSRAIRGRKQAPISGEEGLHNVEVCLAADRARRTGEWECVSPR